MSKICISMTCGTKAQAASSRRASPSNRSPSSPATRTGRCCAATRISGPKPCIGWPPRAPCSRPGTSRSSDPRARGAPSRPVTSLKVERKAPGLPSRRYPMRPTQQIITLSAPRDIPFNMLVLSQPTFARSRPASRSRNWPRVKRARTSVQWSDVSAERHSPCERPGAADAAQLHHRAIRAGRQ